MNKTTVYCMASALAVTMASTPIYSVMADTTSEPVQVQTNVQIKNASDFIQKYLSVSVTKNKVTEYTLITEANEKNYESILEGDVVFENLDESLQQSIIKAYQQEYDKAVKVDTTKTDESLQDKDKKDAYTLLVESAQSVKADLDEKAKQEQEKNSSEKDSKSENGQKTENADNTNTVKKDQTEIENDSETEDKNQSNVSKPETLEINEESKSVISEQKVENPQKNVQSNITSNTNQQSNSVQENKVEQPLLQSAEVKIQSAEKSEQSAVVNSAQTFIQTYLTSKSGNVYATANALNYQNIVKSMSQWLKLSSKQQAEVNRILNNKIGMSYNTLLQKAQEFSMKTGLVSGKNSAKVNTATNTNTTFFEWLCIVSLGFVAFILKRLKKQD